MVVFSRKKGESVVINNDITVTIVEIRGDKVRLGIVHPKEVSVHRQEVFDAIHGHSANPPPAVSAPPAQQPAGEESMPIHLESWHLKFLDRLAMHLKMAHTGRLVRRDEIVQALLEGMEASGIDWSEATSIEQLRSLVAMR